MSGGGGGTNTVQNADPWSGVQPYLKEMFGNSSDMIGAGPMDQYGGQTYAGFNPLQLQGQQGQLDYANQMGGSLSQLFGAQSQMLGGQNQMMGSFQDPMMGAGGVYGDVMGRQSYGDTWGSMGDTAATQALAGQYNQDPMSSQSGQNLAAMQTPGKNPYLDDMVGSALGQVSKNFNENIMGNILQEAQVSGQNIGDSGYLKNVKQGGEAAMKQMGGIASGMYGNAYNQDMNRALQASQAGMGYEGQGASRGLQAAGMGAGFEQQQGQAGIQSQQLLDQMRMSAAGGATSGYGSGLGMANQAQQAGMGMADQNYQMGLLPSQLYGQVGGQQQGMTQQGIDEAMERYYYPQESQQDMMDWYSGILSGAGGLGGSGSSKTSGGGNSTSDLAGTALMAYAMYASDMRLKENIQYVKTVDGQRYYTWDWNDKAREIGVDSDPQSGVMAQELMVDYPELVVTRPDGYLMVNYGGLS